MKRAMCALVLVAVLAGCCGGSGGISTATPADSTTSPTGEDGTAGPTRTSAAAATASPTATAVTLENAAGPLFYYVASPGHAPRIIAVDLATGTTLLDRPLERNTGVLLREGKLAIWEGVAPTELVELELDGSRGEPMYYSPVGISDAAYSPDGEKLAIVLYDVGVVVLVRETNEVIAALNQYEVPLGHDEGSLSRVQ